MNIWPWLLALLLLLWLFRRPLADRLLPRLTQVDVKHQWGDAPAGTYPVDVVGESHYKSNLADIVGGAASMHGVELQKTAVLRPYNNPHDANAVLVMIDGKAVGHLSRAHAVKFRKRLAEAGLGLSQTACPAIITGGGTDAEDGYRYHYGVRLGIKRL